MVYSVYYTHSAEIPPAYPGTIKYRDHQLNNKYILAATFEELTGSKYITSSFPTPLYMKESPLNPDKTHYLSIYSGVSDTNLRLVHILGENAFVGLGVVAARVIKCGEVICHYTGQYVADSQRGSDYQLGPIDAQKFRGLGALINHSFPNAQFDRVCHDIVPEWIIRAIDTIAEGEEITVNYGHGYEKLTLGKHAELRYEAAAKFVKMTTIDQQGTLLHAEKWHYLATNPSVLLELYFNGDWSHDNILLFLGSMSVSDISLPKSFSTLSDLLLHGFKDSHNTLQTIKELEPKVYKEIADYFREASRSRSSSGAVYALRMFSTYMPAYTHPAWPELKAKLDPFIDAWEFINNNRIKNKEVFNDNTPLHRAIRVIRADPLMQNYSFD
ncbi:MAG: SET domain-containing protein-lysine N-methyltransferase [Chlamydiales bacterium]|nr:SET domain-containing protein-lysine N-methyltransferase [Chlamydiales bacterium]